MKTKYWSTFDKCVGFFNMVMSVVIMGLGIVASHLSWNPWYLIASTVFVLTEWAVMLYVLRRSE